VTSSKTMWVVMTLTISGGRADGRPWPDRLSTPIDVPREEGEHLVRVGQAFEVEAPGRAEAPHGPASATPAPVSESSPTAAGPPEAEVSAPEEEAAPEPAAGEEPGDMPKPADAKQAWLDYALSQGADADVAAGMTKADLMSRFGGRL